MVQLNTSSSAPHSNELHHELNATTTVSRGGRYDVPPHGGVLVDRFVHGDRATELLQRAESLPSVKLDSRAASDVELIATGAFSPLEGFLRKEDYSSVVHRTRLASGILFPIPLTLSVAPEEARRYTEGKDVGLVDANGRAAGILRVDEMYPLDVDAEAREVYKTTDPKHPGVAYLLERRGYIALGGPISLARRTIERQFGDHHRDPSEVRALIASRGWRRTVAFQTRNPIHRAHEYLLRCALEMTDGLVVHPLVGETKGDDIPAETRMRCYEVLLDKYFPRDRALLSVFPFAMRYAGPREALLHAIARQNYGFSHFIVGRDHAGVGTYYGTYDAQRIFDTLLPNDLAIQPIFFEHCFFCRACGSVASIKTCPHPDTDHVTLSGTRVRELLGRGEAPPPEYSRHEIAAILISAYQRANEEAKSHVS